jgi:chromosome segregation ATPase
MATLKEHLDKLLNRAENVHSEKETELEHIQETIDKLEEFTAGAEELSRELDTLSELQEELKNEYETDLDD